MFSSRLRWVGAVLATAMLMFFAGTAWACVGVMALTTNVSAVQPGGTFVVSGGGFGQDAPIAIYLDGSTGTLLATVPTPKSTMTSSFDVNVTLPADVSEGQHIVMAIQNSHHMNAGTPARAAVFVGAVAPAPPAPEARPATVTTSSGPSVLALVLLAVAVAGCALLVAAFWNLRASAGRSRAGAG